MNGYALLVENCSDFVGICDIDFNLIYVNRAGKLLLGLENHAKLPNVFNFFSPSDAAFIAETFIPKVLRQGSGEIEIRFRHFETGAAIWMGYSVLVLRDADGKATGYATISRNIDSRKKAEMALAQERTLLAERVKERTRELSLANAELARANRLKNEF
ncbi:MAG: PAS domain-containing protein, partial [Planctomycetales bacterium]|nr:PAS domain-containing protein [Planctomycetales bacterium]